VNPFQSDSIQRTDSTIDSGRINYLFLINSHESRGENLKALIMNGSEPDDLMLKEIAESLSKVMKEVDWETDILELGEMEIAGCVGCFGCWIKTPGVCVIDDISRDLARKIVSSDLLVYLTPIVFGGYSYHLKKAIERMICIVLPFFEKVDGEIHHAKRYDRYPSLIGIGIADSQNQSEERTFRELVARNAINMHAPRFSSAVIVRTDSMESRQDNLVKAVRDVGAVK
jgi:multimeric flavodoxin WrbA